MTTAGQVAGWLVIGLVAGRVARRAADGDRARTANRPSPAAGPLAWDGAGIEAACALILVAVAARSGWGWPAVPYIGLVATLAAVTITDVRHYRVPDRVLAAGAAATIPPMAAIGLLADRPERLAWTAAGAVLLTAPLLAIHLALPHGMGRGDVKLSILLGAGIGWADPHPLAVDLVRLVLWALVAACALALVTAAALRVAGAGAAAGTAGPQPPGRRRTGPPSADRVPFAPALSLATVGVVIAAGPLVR
ncbi:MAG: A24 family peptidase [Acidimicrobiales bacterium]